MIDWEPIETEAHYKGFLLRVGRTRSPLRFSWFVVSEDEVKKAPYWFLATESGSPGKGASKATARGYSSSFEKAKRDAEAMVEAILMQPEPQ